MATTCDFVQTCAWGSSAVAIGLLALALVLSAGTHMAVAQASATPVDQVMAARDWPRALDLLDRALRARPDDAQTRGASVAPRAPTSRTSMQVFTLQVER
jgi:hypothetical protein